MKYELNDLRVLSDRMDWCDIPNELYINRGSIFCPNQRDCIAKIFIGMLDNLVIYCEYTNCYIDVNKYDDVIAIVDGILERSGY